MIRLQKEHSISGLEDRLSALADAAEDTPLVVPNTLRERQYLGVAATIQLIATWRQRCPVGDLRVHVKDGDNDDQVATVLDGLVRQDHGLVAVSLADRVTSVTGSRDLTEMARARMAARLDTMTDVEALKRGSKAFVMCLDRSAYAAPSVLYTHPIADEFGVSHGEPRLLGDGDWQDLAEELDTRLWATTRRGRASVRDVGALAGLLRELIRNTHHWARTDERGVSYGAHRSVRGFRLEAHTLKAEEHAAALGDAGPLVDYFAHPHLTDRKGQRRFVELTVFDTGPGLAARLLRERLGDTSPSREDESRAVQECIRKWVTSSGEGHRGQGLAEVVRLANRAGGFLRIRTGHAGFYRDYVADPCAGGDDVEVRPWEADQPLAEVAGTSIGAILPVVTDA